jgi:hypothetical protein
MASSEMASSAGGTPTLVRDEAASDGCFPLITNDRDLSAADVLPAHRDQPLLERRHHCLKLLHIPTRNYRST